MRLPVHLLLPLALLWVPMGGSGAQSSFTPTVAGPIGMAGMERPGVVQQGVVGFGGALAISAGEVLAGEGATTLREGRVYIYGRDAAGSWSERAALTADHPRPGDGFGSVLAVEGPTLFVSAPNQNEGGGAVFVFQREPDGWRPSDRLLGPDAGEAADFGAALAAHGDWVFVGAPGHDGGRGAVFLFQREGDGWRERGVLHGREFGAEVREGFGSALAAEGRTLFVGVPGASARTGSVLVFRWNPGAAKWLANGRLSASGLGRSSAFGSRMALEAGRLVVSAPGFGSFGSAAYVFELAPDGLRWLPRSRLAAFDGSPQDNFGSGVALNSGEIWVGASQVESARGAVYLFSSEITRWTRVIRIEAEDGRGREMFGGTLAAEGDLAAVGALGTDPSTGRVVIFERDAHGEWAKVASVEPEPEALAAVTGGSLECDDGGFVAHFPCASMELLSFIPVPALGGRRGIRLNDVWGWTDPEEEREYALLGRTDGMAFVDVTDPTAPVYVGEMLRTEGSSIATWRDMKVYHDHLFVVADASGAHGMQIFDLRRLRGFTGTPASFEPDLTYTQIHSAHNIAVNEETGFAYVVGANGGGQTCGGGLHMIDIRNPRKPTFAGCFSDPETGRASTGYTHDAQCVVYRGPDERHQGREICFGANETALSIADVTDKGAPFAIARAGYPNVGYSHQGWLTPDHRYFYMNDELDELSGLVANTRTIIWDVGRLDDPQVAAEYFGPHTASDHNLYIVGDLMYQSNYASGLRVVDISEPEAPVEVGHLDTAPFDAPVPGFSGSWSNYPFFPSGTVAVTSINEGLFLVRYSPPRTVF